MKSILFVDDEPRVLDGLQRMLRPMRNEWETHFATGGEEALAVLGTRPFDVVVSDIRMPGMDGATLLRRVQEQWPVTARLILSGHAELETAMRAVPVAHQFLTKPCEADAMMETIRRVLGLHDLLRSEVIRETVGRLDTLPAQPNVYTELLLALADPDYTVDDLTGILERDPALTAKILQTVNSGFFGRARSVTSLRMAVSILGSNLIKNMTLASEVFRTFDAIDAIPGSSAEEQQKHALLTAALAREIMAGDRRSDDAFTAGVLHDVGKLVLAAHCPEWLAESDRMARNQGRPGHEVERELRGVCHAEVGAYLLGLWAVPAPIVEAVAHHHSPKRAGARSVDILTAVHVAEALANEWRFGREPDGSEPPEGLDMDYLREIGAEDMLPKWRARAETTAFAQAAD